MDDLTAAGPRPAGQPLSTGTYLALAALNRLDAQCPEGAFADWWKTTAVDRFTKDPGQRVEHRRFWDAIHAVTMEQLDRLLAPRTPGDRPAQPCMPSW